MHAYAHQKFVTDYGLSDTTDIFHFSLPEAVYILFISLKIVYSINLITKFSEFCWCRPETKAKKNNYLLLFIFFK